MEWKDFIQEEVKKEYYQKMLERIRNENQLILPKAEDVFKCFRLCPFEKTKLVIIGQDPYYNIKQQPDGLAFSSPQLTPSLQKIIHIVKEQLGEEMGTKLDYLAEQGVLLLNSCLTTVVGKPDAHANYGWEKFNASMLEALNWNTKHPIFFMLWGAKAKQFKRILTNPLFEVVECEHPANAVRENRHWLCNHFSLLKEFLIKNNIKLVFNDSKYKTETYCNSGNS